MICPDLVVVTFFVSTFACGVEFFHVSDLLDFYCFVSLCSVLPTPASCTTFGSVSFLSVSVLFKDFIYFILFI